MRVLVVHNRYVSALPSGENTVVEEDIAALRGAGVEVLEHIRSSDEIAGMSAGAKVALATRPVHSKADAEAVARLIDEARPDVMHVHNLFPLISPAAVQVAVQAGVPVVQSVHNYRHLCIAGSLFRNDAICEVCVGRVPWRGVVHGCYRGSRPQSLTMATAAVVHRRTWRGVSRFLAPTSFVADKLALGGVPRARITVRPNSTADPGPSTPPGTGFLFAGRLDQQKGILALLDAWRLMPAGSRLAIAGDGPHAEAVRRLARERDDVRYLGGLAARGVAEAMTAAAVVVVPSLWYEPFGRVVIEAFARGRPVLASDLGPLPALVTADVGWTTTPRADAFAAAMTAVSDVKKRGVAARARFLERFTPERTLQQLIGVYQEVRDAGPAS